MSRINRVFVLCVLGLILTGCKELPAEEPKPIVLETENFAFIQASKGQTLIDALNVWARTQKGRIITGFTLVPFVHNQVLKGVAGAIVQFEPGESNPRYFDYCTRYDIDAKVPDPVPYGINMLQLWYYRNQHLQIIDPAPDINDDGEIIGYVILVEQKVAPGPIEQSVELQVEGDVPSPQF